MSKAVKRTMKGWAIGLLNAAMAGAFMLIVEPTSIINDPSHAGRLVLGGVLVNVLGYLQKSPIPTGDEDVAEDQK